MLAASDPTIEQLGPARVGGVSTLRYRVTTTYGRVLDVLAGDEDASDCDPHDRAAKLAVVLWIDPHGLVRRERLRYRLVDGGPVVETRDITRYDRDVRVTVPSGPTVRDITDSLLTHIAGLKSG